MTSKAIWKGAISLAGAIVIPIKLSKATSSHDIGLHEYHKLDMARSGRKTICKGCGEDLVSGDIIKGYEYAKGQVVSFTKDELDSLPVKSVKVIEVDRFVDRNEIPAMIMESTYFIEAEDIGAKALKLFQTGIENKDKIAIGKLAKSGKESICAISVENGGLTVSTLLWADEVREQPSGLPAEVSTDEVELIERVIDKFSKPFVHTDFTDEYTNAIKEMAQKKIDGQEIEITADISATPTASLSDALGALLD